MSCLNCVNHKHAERCADIECEELDNRPRQAGIILMMFAAFALLCGFGEIYRQKQHRAEGQGTALDRLWENPPVYYGANKPTPAEEKRLREVYGR